MARVVSFHVLLWFVFVPPWGLFCAPCSVCCAIIVVSVCGYGRCPRICFRCSQTLMPMSLVHGTRIRGKVVSSLAVNRDAKGMHLHDVGYSFCFSLHH